ncbi:putative elongation factor 1-beta [Amylocarpus encephaloides]|uniref:Elongation factor 1-beta n=1 Tax=Amylocarpus encephaloides TaxID=45428 RepID=A0A9P8C6E4_9HELO|nr:putative elongation factor 1-beta [Amylocarpus encephaloides]
MGFADVLTDAGLTGKYSPSQADVATFKALKSSPDAAKYPHAARWYKHMNSYSDDFATLPAKAPATEEDDDEVDLFGSDDEEEDAEAERIKNERLAEYKKKKEGKTKPAAKSVVTMDVKPWDDETDMKLLEAAVRSINKEGLVWGASKLAAVGFGIKKLQINLVIEDDKIGLSDLQEEIEEFEDYVQSSDITPFSVHVPPATMTWLSTSITGLGVVFLAHACYSAHEHSALLSISAASLSSITSHSPTVATLPIDITVESIVAVFAICLGLVLGTPDLRPIQWRVWAGKIEREGEKGFMNGDGEVDKDYAGNPFRLLESRPGFIDIRKQRTEFAEWVREGGEIKAS